MATPVTVTELAQAEQLLAVLASSSSSWPGLPGNILPQTSLPWLTPGSVPVFPQLKGMCGTRQDLSPPSPSCRHAMHSGHGDKRGCLLPLLMKLVSNNHILDNWVWPQLKKNVPFPFLTLFAFPLLQCLSPVQGSILDPWDLLWQLLCSLHTERPSCSDSNVRPSEIPVVLEFPFPKSKYFLSAVPIIDRSHVT